MGGARSWHQVAAESDPDNKAGKLEVLFEGKFYCNLQLGSIRNPVQLAKRLDPADPTAWLYAALLSQRQNRINDAVRDLERSQE